MLWRSDFLARWGGEEFLLLPGVDMAAGRAQLAVTNRFLPVALAS